MTADLIPAEAGDGPSAAPHHLSHPAISIP